MPASEALQRYQQYLQAHEREHLAWETCERLRQAQPLDLGAYWDAQRAYERAQREQAQAWMSYEEVRRANAREAAARGAWDPLTPPPVFSEITSTSVVLTYGKGYTFMHPHLGIIGGLMTREHPDHPISLDAYVAGVPSDPEWVVRLALLDELARVCQRELCQRFGTPVAAPAALIQAKRQIRLCQRFLLAATSAEAGHLSRQVPARERPWLREALDKGLWEVLADQVGLSFAQMAERKQEMWRVLEHGQARLR